MGHGWISKAFLFKKADTKGHILYDPVYVTLYDIKGETAGIEMRWLQGAGVGRQGTSAKRQEGTPFGVTGMFYYLTVVVVTWRYKFAKIQKRVNFTVGEHTTINLTLKRKRKKEKSSFNVKHQSGILHHLLRVTPDPSLTLTSTAEALRAARENGSIVA